MSPEMNFTVNLTTGASEAIISDTGGTLFTILEVSSIAIIILLSAVTNGMLVRFIMREDRCRTHTNLLVLSQCITDLATTFFIMPIDFLDVVGVNESLPGSLCIVHEFFSHWFLSLTMLNIAALILDRYRIIVKRRWNFGSRKRILALVTVFWIHTLFFTIANIVPFLSRRNLDTNYNLSACLLLRSDRKTETFRKMILIIEFVIDKAIPSAVIVYCFYYILHAVHSTRVKVIAVQDVHNWRKIIVGIYAKSENTCIIIAVSFILCISPYIVNQFLLSQHITTSKTTITTVTWLWFSNASIKPVIYIVRSDQWLKGYSNYLRCRKRLPENKEIPLSSASNQRIAQIPEVCNTRHGIMSPQSGKTGRKFYSKPKDFYDIFTVCHELPVTETSHKS